jgi:hypothetical protein
MSLRRWSTLLKSSRARFAANTNQTIAIMLLVSSASWVACRLVGMAGRTIDGLMFSQNQKSELLNALDLP